VLVTGTSRRASARREDRFQSKDLDWLDPCDKHRDEGGEHRKITFQQLTFEKAASGLAWQLFGK